jgi:hypothetical protein
LSFTFAQTKGREKKKGKEKGNQLNRERALPSSSSPEVLLSLPNSLADSESQPWLDSLFLPLPGGGVPGSDLVVTGFLSHFA